MAKAIGSIIGKEKNMDYFPSPVRTYHLFGINSRKILKRLSLLLTRGVKDLNFLLNDLRHNLKTLSIGFGRAKKTDATYLLCLFLKGPKR